MDTLTELVSSTVMQCPLLPALPEISRLRSEKKFSECNEWSVERPGQARPGKKSVQELKVANIIFPNVKKSARFKLKPFARIDPFIMTRDHRHRKQHLIITKSYSQGSRTTHPIVVSKWAHLEVDLRLLTFVLA